MAWYFLPEFDIIQEAKMSNNTNLSHYKGKRKIISMYFFTTLSREHEFDF